MLFTTFSLRWYNPPLCALRPRMMRSLSNSTKGKWKHCRHHGRVQSQRCQQLCCHSSSHKGIVSTTSQTLLVLKSIRWLSIRNESLFSASSSLCGGFNASYKRFYMAHLSMDIVLIFLLFSLVVLIQHVFCRRTINTWKDHRASPIFRFHPTCHRFWSFTIWSLVRFSNKNPNR